eukprot:41536_1
MSKFAVKKVFQATQKKLRLVETTWRGAQPAWSVTCDKLELVLTKHGLNIASVTHIDDPNKLNPFWVPQWPWKSPIECPHLHISKTDEEIYGNREDSQLLSNICGHSLCIDRFGICKLTDEPRTCHGEAPVLEWQLNQCTNNIVSFSVHLPLARLHLKRAFNFEDDVVYVTTWIENASNRFHDFFETKDKEANESDRGREAMDGVNTYTVNEMKEDICKQQNIGTRGDRSTTLNMNASSFMNLPSNKQQRKRTKVRRDATNLQRTYDIVRSFMEEEYRVQVMSTTSDKIKQLFQSPKAFIDGYQQKKNKSYQKQLDNETLNDDVIQQMFNKQHETYIEAKDEDLVLTFAEDDRVRYDVEWTEHVTISDPFLNDAQFILPRHTTEKNIAYNCPLPMDKSRFNGENEVRLDECLEIPKCQEKESKRTEATACIVDDDVNDEKEFNETSFIVRNERLGYELEYEWNAKTFPWLCIWTEHYGTDYVPWNANERCRGLEISTKPFPIPCLENELSQNELTKHKHNQNIHCWNGKAIDFMLPGDGKAETFALRWSPITSK